MGAEYTDLLNDTRLVINEYNPLFFPMSFKFRKYDCVGTKVCRSPVLRI